MKKHIKQNERGIELLELDKRLHELFYIKHHMYARSNELRNIFKEKETRLSHQKLMGEDTTAQSAILSSELLACVDEMDRTETRVNAEILDIEKKTAFLEGKASGRTEAAKAGASARGNKYSTMKTAALEWYSNERQKFHNKDDAAIEITKIHPVEFSTARGWLKGV